MLAFWENGGVSWTDKGTLAVLAAQLLVLVAAAIFAGWQALEARRFREAQFRPFVILDFSYRDNFAELTIKNIGSTLARHVRFKVDLPWKTSLDTDPEYVGYVLADSYIFREEIPSLPPGKEITVVFDREPQRSNMGLPDRYTVEATYDGPFGHSFRDPPLVLDLAIYRDRGPIHLNGLHELYQLLEKRLPQ
jgi:hypothetical protein